MKFSIYDPSQSRTKTRTTCHRVSAWLLVNLSSAPVIIASAGSNVFPKRTLSWEINIEIEKRAYREKSLFLQCSVCNSYVRKCTVNRLKSRATGSERSLKLAFPRDERSNFSPCQETFVYPSIVRVSSGALRERESEGVKRESRKTTLEHFSLFSSAWTLCCKRS